MSDFLHPRSYTFLGDGARRLLILGCLVLPVKLPFRVPGVCRSPRPAERSAPARRVPQRPVLRPVPRSRTPARIIRPAPAQQTTAIASPNALESQVQTAVNQVRRSHGLRPLKGNGRLAQVARNHSRNMASRSFFGHTDPSGRTSADRVQGAGIRYQLVAENLAWVENAPDPIDHIVRGWMNSPGHRANILRQGVKETGVGVSRVGNRYFFTQLFMAR